MYRTVFVKRAIACLTMTVALNAIWISTSCGAPKVSGVSKEGVDWAEFAKGVERVVENRQLSWSEGRRDEYVNVVLDTVKGNEEILSIYGSNEFLDKLSEYVESLPGDELLTDTRFALKKEYLRWRINEFSGVVRRYSEERPIRKRQIVEALKFGRRKILEVDQRYPEGPLRRAMAKFEETAISACENLFATAFTVVVPDNMHREQIDEWLLRINEYLTMERVEEDLERYIEYSQSKSGAESVVQSLELTISNNIYAALARYFGIRKAHMENKPPELVELLGSVATESRRRSRQQARRIQLQDAIKANRRVFARRLQEYEVSMLLIESMAKLAGMQTWWSEEKLFEGDRKQGNKGGCMKYQWRLDTVRYEEELGCESIDATLVGVFHVFGNTVRCDILETEPKWRTRSLFFEPVGTAFMVDDGAAELFYPALWDLRIKRYKVGAPSSEVGGHQWLESPFKENLLSLLDLNVSEDRTSHPIFYGYRAEIERVGNPSPRSVNIVSRVSGLSTRKVLATIRQEMHEWKKILRLDVRNEALLLRGDAEQSEGVIIANPRIHVWEMITANGRIVKSAIVGKVVEKESERVVARIDVSPPVVVDLSMENVRDLSAEVAASGGSPLAHEYYRLRKKFFLYRQESDRNGYLSEIREQVSRLLHNAEASGDVDYILCSEHLLMDVCEVSDLEMWRRVALNHLERVVDKTDEVQRYRECQWLLHKSARLKEYRVFRESRRKLINVIAEDWSEKRCVDGVVEFQNDVLLLNCILAAMVQRGVEFGRVKGIEERFEKSCGGVLALLENGLGWSTRECNLIFDHLGSE